MLYSCSLDNRPFSVLSLIATKCPLTQAKMSGTPAVSRQTSWGWEPKVSLQEGLRKNVRFLPVALSKGHTHTIKG